MDKIKADVLRYLGRQGQEVPENLSSMVDESIALMRKTALFREVHLSFPIFYDGGDLALAGTEICLRGKDISRHLSGCKEAVLMAATLGTSADALILKWERTDLTRSLMLDACATQLIEECCDNIERRICAEAASSRLRITSRFSPGYGDFLLDIQPLILRTLNAERIIGLYCTEHCILLPRKSVTALIGLKESENESRRPKRCERCESCEISDTCSYRKFP